MKRRNFIQNTGKTAVGGILIPITVFHTVSGKKPEHKLSRKTKTKFCMETGKLYLDKPVVVAQAPPELNRAADGWGRWQFPHITRLKDGRLMVYFSIEPDSAWSYGKPVGVAFSSDNGKTWNLGAKQTVHEIDNGVLLPNGDRLKPVTLKTRHAEDFDLPPSVHDWICTYGYPRSIYCAEDLPKELRGWRFSRLPAGKRQWIEEDAIMHIPDELRVVTNEKAQHAILPENVEQVRRGALPLPFISGRIHIAPDKSLWAVTDMCRQYKEKILWAPIFLRSIDYGHTWYMFGEIQYKGGDGNHDPHASEREGFTETDYNFRPDGSVICLMRTSDGNGVGPLYLTRSVNYWRTWSKPQVFDNFGKWPQLLPLDNGVTLASYGQSGGPGYFVVRATSDPSGLDWQAPVKMMLSPEAKEAWDTCGHTEMIVLDSNHALIVYSDFNYPDSRGIKRKTILTRLIEVSG